MIAHLKGQLTYKSPEYTIVDVNGVGYKVFTPLSTYYALPNSGQTVSLRIHTRVREDELKLFGFLTEEEQTIFQKLITINKVGPRLALGILSGMSPADLLSAVMNNDSVKLSTIPGVGKKTAERLLIELEDKVSTLGTGSLPLGAAHPAGDQSARLQAEEALEALGYKPAEAAKLLDKSNSEGQSVEQMIRLALRSAAR